VNSALLLQGFPRNASRTLRRGWEREASERTAATKRVTSAAVPAAAA
jgi:hypothetical protein